MLLKNGTRNFVSTDCKRAGKTISRNTRINSSTKTNFFTDDCQIMNVAKQEDDIDQYCNENLPDHSSLNSSSEIMSSPKTFNSLHTRVRSHSRSLRAMANPSAVWAHFDLCSNDPLRAQCRLCRAIVVRGGANPRQCGTTNLHRHLRVHHGGKLIDKRYHVMNQLINQEPVQSQTKALKLVTQGFVHEMHKITSSLDSESLQRNENLKQHQESIQSKRTQQKDKITKTVMLKAIPLKVKKKIAMTSIKSISSKQSNLKQPPPQIFGSQQPTEVCLKWNSYHSNMQNSFPSFLDSEEFVDVTLACEGRSLKCHKMILSSCSDYLAQLLRDNPCQHPIIVMKDLKFWEVDALVNFMYRGEVNVTHDKLPHLLTAAETLQIKGLAGPNTSQNLRAPLNIPQAKTLLEQFSLNIRSGKNKFFSNSGSKSTFLLSNSREKFDNVKFNVRNANQPISKIRLRHPLQHKSSETSIKTEPMEHSSNLELDQPCVSRKKSEVDLGNLPTFDKLLNVTMDTRMEKNYVNLPLKKGKVEKGDFKMDYADNTLEEIIPHFLEQEQNTSDSESTEDLLNIYNSFTSTQPEKKKKNEPEKRDYEEKKIKCFIYENLQDLKEKKRFIKLRSDHSNKQKT